MDFHEIQKYAEYLFRIALKKCGDINDAEDLTQEVLLTYLNYRGEISNIKSWLYSVLSHKYNDMLRKKYKLPIVSIDVIPDETEIWDTNDDNSKDKKLIINLLPKPDKKLNLDESKILNNLKLLTKEYQESY